MIEKLKESEEVIIRDAENGEVERFTLPAKLNNVLPRAFVKAGTPVIQLIENTTTQLSRAGLILPVRTHEQHKMVLDRDIAVIVLREESPGVFECLYKSNKIFVRYCDMQMTVTSKDLATLKDKETVIQ